MNFARLQLWSRNLLWILVGAVWIVIISLPALGLLLAARGEISWQPSEHHGYRVWVIMEQEERGIGWEVRRTASYSVERVCLQTTVGFWLWRSQVHQQQTRYSFCECYMDLPDTEMEYLGTCSPRSQTSLASAVFSLFLGPGDYVLF